MRAHERTLKAIKGAEILFAQRGRQAYLYPRLGAAGQVYRIVGEDEADPKGGSISFVSPVARALMGKSVGDTVIVNDQELEIVSIA